MEQRRRGSQPPDSKSSESGSTKWVIGVSVAGLIVSAVTAVFSFYNNRIASNALFASTRAWLRPTDFIFRWEPKEPTGIVYVTGFTENIGHDPAIGPVFSPPGSAESGFVPYHDGRIKMPLGQVCPVEAESGNVIFPSQKYPYDANVTGVTQEEWNEVQAGRQVFYIHNCVAYKTMNKTYHTEFCVYAWKHPIKPFPQISFCEDGNKVFDTDYPY